MSLKPIKIGVIGVGHLGKHHVKHYSRIPSVKLVGLYDLDFKRSSLVAKKYRTTAYKNLKSLLMM